MTNYLSPHIYRTMGKAMSIFEYCSIVNVCTEESIYKTNHEFTAAYNESPFKQKDDDKAPPKCYTKL